jgi:hypothetical protein
MVTAGAFASAEIQYDAVLKEVEVQFFFELNLLESRNTTQRRKIEEI